VPTVLLGISVLLVLKDGPEKAEWLNPQEKLWLAGELERDRALYGAGEHHGLLDVFRMPAVWLLAGVYVVIQIGVYVVNLWMPLILDSLARGAVAGDASVVARYATVPYVLAAVFTLVVGWSSDRWNERRGHLAGCMLLAAVGFGWTAVAPNVVVGLSALSVAAMGLWSTMGPFWALMTRMVKGAAAAGGVAMITTLGGLGGFTGPYVTGRLRDATHSFAGGLYAIAGLALCAAVLSLAVRSPRVVSAP
jgi:ACS family tartrate transporter-like MFS transporter